MDKALMRIGVQVRVTNLAHLEHNSVLRSHWDDRMVDALGSIAGPITSLSNEVWWVLHEDGETLAPYHPGELEHYLPITYDDLKVNEQEIIVKRYSFIVFVEANLIPMGVMREDARAAEIAWQPFADRFPDYTSPPCKDPHWSGEKQGWIVEFTVEKEIGRVLPSPLEVGTRIHNHLRENVDLEADLQEIVVDYAEFDDDDLPF